MSILTEGNLQLYVPDDVKARRFDGGEHGLSHCMKAVDFVIELGDRYLFLEIKDPRDRDRQTGGTRPKTNDEFQHWFRSEKVDADLKYKYRDSFLYEWAAGRANKPVFYLVLIALETLDAAELLARQDSLGRNRPISPPGSVVWKRRFVNGCGVFNIETWNRRFPQYPVERIPDPKTTHR